VTEEIITHSAEETTNWGRNSPSALRLPFSCFSRGDLGTGKTTLTKGIVSGLGAANEDDVTSPTFTLVHVYGKPAKVYHADLYRIESFHDFETLGMEDIFATPSVAILEWSERFPSSLPGRRSACVWSISAATPAASPSCRPTKSNAPGLHLLSGYGPSRICCPAPLRLLT